MQVTLVTVYLGLMFYHLCTGEGGLVVINYEQGPRVVGLAKSLLSPKFVCHPIKPMAYIYCISINQCGKGFKNPDKSKCLISHYDLRLFL